MLIHEASPLADLGGPVLTGGGSRGQSSPVASSKALRQALANFLKVTPSWMTDVTFAILTSAIGRACLSLIRFLPQARSACTGTGVVL
jgi:hypothetical protein